MPSLIRDQRISILRVSVHVTAWRRTRRASISAQPVWGLYSLALLLGGTAVDTGENVCCVCDTQGGVTSVCDGCGATYHTYTTKIYSEPSTLPS